MKENEELALCMYLACRLRFALVLECIWMTFSALRIKIIILAHLWIHVLFYCWPMK